LESKAWECFVVVLELLEIMASAELVVVHIGSFSALQRHFAIEDYLE
jgi:hypothetical protein